MDLCKADILSPCICSVRSRICSGFFPIIRLRSVCVSVECRYVKGKRRAMYRASIWSGRLTCRDVIGAINNVVSMVGERSIVKWTLVSGVQMGLT